MLCTIPNQQNPGDFLFKPRLHDFNFNASIDYQPLKKIRTYLYYSLGRSFGTLYEYEGGGGYLNCKGISEGIGLGIRYINILDNYNFNIVYGVEARLHRTKINEIDDSSEIAYINGIDMYSKGFIFSIGTIFGGEKTTADYSFLKMLNEDYISAKPGFQEYINNAYPVSRKKLANKMLTFTETQIPYQQYDNGIYNQKIGNIDSAIYWFDQASQTANSELLFEIKTHKKDLAIMLIDSVNIYKSTMTFDIAENIILKAKKLIDDYYYVNEILADLYIKKGEAFEKAGNYKKAYMYYNKSEIIYPNSNVELIEKYNRLTNNLVREADIASNNGDFSFAIESLNFAIDITPEKNNELTKIIEELYAKLTKEEAIKIKRKIKNIVEEKKIELENSINKKILIGMSSAEVEDAIGAPIIKDTINKGERIYELWTYNNHPSLNRVYFEENLVIKVE